MQYSTPYILLVCLFLIISFFQIFFSFDNKSNNGINKIVGLSFICFFGLRGFVGWDWYSYYPYFKILPDLFNINSIKLPFEIGFNYYSSLIKTIYPNYSFYTFINTCTDFILLHYFFKRYLPANYYTLGIALFVAFGGIPLEINLIRNIKGFLLFLISIQYIEKKQLLKFIALNSIGLLFHWSSLFFFPLYFILYHKINIRVLLIFFIIGNIIYLSQLEYIKPIVQLISKGLGGIAESKADVYLKSSIYSKQYGITFGYIERVLTAVLVLLYYENLIRESKKNILFINSFFIFLFINLYLSEYVIVISRIGSLFLFSYWILWPQLIKISNTTIKFMLFFVLALYLNIRTNQTVNTILYEYDNVMIGNSKSLVNRKKAFIIEAKKLDK